MIQLFYRSPGACLACEFLSQLRQSKNLQFSNLSDLLVLWFCEIAVKKKQMKTKLRKTLRIWVCFWTSGKKLFWEKSLNGGWSSRTTRPFRRLSPWNWRTSPPHQNSSRPPQPQPLPPPSTWLEPLAPKKASCARRRTWRTLGASRRNTHATVRSVIGKPLCHLFGPSRLVDYFLVCAKGEAARCIVFSHLHRPSWCGKRNRILTSWCSFFDCPRFTTIEHDCDT